MNLIEQLGGYEKASEDFKKLHLNLKEQQKSNKVFMDAFDALKTELLEYRREHNIFEVGGKVVVLTNALGNKYIWIVKSIDGIMVEISQLGQPNEWVHYSEIAHATDAEIKAGKRLEVNQ